jgi:molybdopterin/thiamine biosynthesis adenylyltransferase
MSTIKQNINKVAGEVKLAQIGAGNIGSYLASLAARIGGVHSIVLIDSDNYEEKNRFCQDIKASDIGQPKARVQAAKLRLIRPDLKVRAIHARVEDLPLGLLRSTVILGCVDSLAGRSYINQVAWRLGVPWIDAAVDAERLLVRVSAYIPGTSAPCIECAWDDNDYAALEQSYPCLGEHGMPATNAPASLGAVAAGLMAIELEKLLSGDVEHLLAGRSVMHDLRHHTQDVTIFRRNPRCRFDHQTWQIESLTGISENPTIKQVISLACNNGESTDAWALGLEGHAFTRMQYCGSCGFHGLSPLRLARRIPAKQRLCVKCGATMVIRGIDMFESLNGQMLKKSDLRRTLSSVGFLRGDVLSLECPDGKKHFELAAGRRFEANDRHGFRDEPAIGPRPQEKSNAR